MNAMRHWFEASAVFVAYAGGILSLWTFALWATCCVIDHGRYKVKMLGAFREWLFTVYFKREMAKAKRDEARR